MQDLIITIGHNVAGVPTHDEASILEALRWALDPEGFTAYPCQGSWHGEREASTRIEISALDDAEAARLVSCVPALARLLDQEAIALEVKPSALQFIAAA